jgi:O-antigen/teichoic acid export membrane protein
LIFHGETDAISSSAPLLALLGFSVTLSCLVTVTNAILQAYNSPTIPILSMAIGSAVKIIFAYYLIGNQRIGLLGAPISTFFCDLVINLVNFAFISKKMKTMPKLSDVFMKQFVAAAISVGIARLIYNIIITRQCEQTKITLASIALAAIVYLVLSLCLGILRKEDIPFVNKKNIIIKKEE